MREKLAAEHRPAATSLIFDCLCALGKKVRDLDEHYKRFYAVAVAEFYHALAQPVRRTEELGALTVSALK